MKAWRSKHLVWLLILMVFAGAAVLWNQRGPGASVEPPVNFNRLDPQLRLLILEKARSATARPRDAARHADLGLVYSANSLWLEATKAYSNALRCGSVDPMVWQYRGVALMQATQFGLAKESLTKAVAIKPDSVSALWHLGHIHLQTGSTNEAEAAFRQLIQVRPSEWRGLAGVGQTLLQKGQTRDAIPLLEKAVALAPREAAAHALLARALLATGDQGRARVEMALGKDSELSPPSDDWSERARSYRKTIPDQMEIAQELEAAGKFTEAAVLLGEVVRFHPTNATVLNRLAVALNHLGNGKEGEFYARRALAVDPNFLPARVTLSFSLVIAGQNAAGLAEADQAMRAAPTIVQPYLARANALLALGRDAEAAQALRAGLELEPTNAQLLVELGDVTWRNLGDAVEAQRIYRRAHDAEISFSPAINRLIEWEVELGHPAAAASWLTKLRIVEGETTVVLEWTQRLKKMKSHP